MIYRLPYGMTSRLCFGELRPRPIHQRRKEGWRYCKTTWSSLEVPIRVAAGSLIEDPAMDVALALVRRVSSRSSSGTLERAGALVRRIPFRRPCENKKLMADHSVSSGFVLFLLTLQNESLQRKLEAFFVSIV